MGKVAGATETTKRKKKKGRPSLLDLQKRALEQQQQLQNRRSTRRNPNSGGDGVSDYIDEEDDDDERKEKKVKLVVRLPHQSQNNNFPSNSGGSSDSNADGENHEVSVKINAGSGDSGADQGEKVSKATDTLHGSPLESGPTTPLPDKKLLVFILDRLQKKDTYGVFSEPVDPNELPDYHEIIEHPMDFGTVRSKLDQGLYQNLEELEADVLLICSNAMQYNSSDTVYFRQARSIQELAKRDFENLRQEGDDGVIQPKVVKRGRPPGKHPKKPVGRPPLDRVGPESTSGATLATAEDNATESNPYNLRRAPVVYNKYHSADGLPNSQRARNGEQYTEWSSDWNEEFPANIRKADMKYGKKHFNIDETRRDTYKQFHPSLFVQESSLLSSFPGDRKQLMPVGLHVEHGYARSLARFAANLGPVVWKIASKKIERVLPPGTSFGPGRVGENEASPPRSSFFSPENQRNLHRLANDGLPSGPETPPSGAISAIANRPSLPCKEEVDVVDDRRVHSQNESSVLRGGVSGIRPGLSFQTQPNKPQLHHGRNGYNGMFGCNFPSQMGLAAQKPRPDEVSGQLIAADAAPAHIQSEATATDSTSISAKPSCWQQVSSSTNHRQFSLPVPPDLNVGLQGSGSPQQPSSGLRIGSPQQPDLALQL